MHLLEQIEKQRDRLEKWRKRSGYCVIVVVKHLQRVSARLFYSSQLVKTSSDKVFYCQLVKLAKYVLYRCSGERGQKE